MNRGRPRYDDILTPREWEVLALIEEGLTNEQIATQLGISFGTAKYHVAEIISKLGVKRREAAPAAARRARAPALPFWLAWLRGRFGWSLIGAGVVAAAALILLSVVVLTDVLRAPSKSVPDGDLSDAAADFQPGDAASEADVLTRAPARLSSFYYEVAVSSAQPQAPGAPARNTTMRAEVWHEAPDRWRVIYYDGAGNTRDVHVTDGEIEWHFDAEEVSYYSRPAEFDPAYGLQPRPLLGPIPLENLQAFMDEWNDGPAHYWEVNEAGAVLGRKSLELLQGCCRQGQLNQRISEQRYLVDPIYNFLLSVEERAWAPAA